MELLGVTYRNETGVLFSRQPLAIFAIRANLQQISPVRMPASYKGQHHLPGYLWMSKTNSLIAYESRLEMVVLLHLDSQKDVLGVIPQPFQLHYKSNDRVYRHTPDFLVYFENGNAEVINVKPKQFVATERNVRAFSACEEAANEMGWTYTTRSELDPVFLANIRWLGGFRRKPPYFEQYAPLLVNGAVDCPSIEKLINDVGGPPSLIRPVLFFLIWQHIICVDLYKRFTNLTIVSLPQ